MAYSNAMGKAILQTFSSNAYTSCYFRFSQVTRGWTTRGPWRLHVWKEQCLLGPPFGTSLLKSLPALSRSYATVWSESYRMLVILKASSFHFFLMTVVDLKKFTELDSHHETFPPKPYWRSSSSETSPFICGDGSLAGQRRDYCVDHATLRSEQSIFVVGLGSESCQEWHSFSPQTSQGLLQGQIVCTVETIPWRDI